MKAEILCSSRELFGADRCALRLAEVLGSIGVASHLVVPAGRPELGLSDEARKRGISYRESNIAIATSSGIEAPLAVLPQHYASDADLTIFNSTAVLGSQSRVKQKIIIVREWLEPRSVRHRALVYRHRLGADAMVGISSDVISQWRSCTRGPKRQFLINDWLEQDFLEASRSSVVDARGKHERSGILCIGRFNSWKGQEILADAYEEAFASGDKLPLLSFVGAQKGTSFADRAEAVRARGEKWGWEVLPFTVDPASHFRRAALVVVPSLKPEPFGMVMLEALAYGCRVLAFEGGGPSDVELDFPRAVSTTIRTTQSLASALATWWSEGGTALSASERGEVWSTLDRRYSPDTRAETWQEVIEAIAR